MLTTDEKNRRQKNRRGWKPDSWAPRIARLRSLSKKAYGHTRIDFTKHNLRVITVSDTVFTDDRFNDSNLHAATFSGCSFVNGVEFMGADIDYAHFENCEFMHTDFSRANLQNAEFIDCTFESCKFVNADMGNGFISGCTFKKCNFTNVNFCNTTIGNDSGAFDTCWGIAEIYIPHMSSRDDRLIAVWDGTDAMFKAGCFWGNFNEFNDRLSLLPIPNSKRANFYRDAAQLLRKGLMWGAPPLTS